MEGRQEHFKIKVVMWMWSSKGYKCIFTYSLTISTKALYEQGFSGYWFLLCNRGIIPEYTAAKLNFRGSGQSCRPQRTWYMQCSHCYEWPKFIDKDWRRQYVNPNKLVHLDAWITWFIYMEQWCSFQQYKKLIMLSNTPRPLWFKIKWI